jgi:hypothetical protein
LLQSELQVIAMSSDDSYAEVDERVTAVTPMVDRVFSEVLANTLSVAEADGNDNLAVVERVRSPAPARSGDVLSARRSGAD